MISFLNWNGYNLLTLYHYDPLELKYVLYIAKIMSGYLAKFDNDISVYSLIKFT